MCCCFKVISKIMILIVNFTVILLGIGLIITGSLLVFFRSSLPDISGINISIAAGVTIGVGCFVCLVAFCGCCGAIADSGCLLITHAVLTFLLAAFNIFVAVTLIKNKDDVNRAFADSFESLFKTSPDRFQGIEYFFKCCGTTGVDSYDKIESNFPPTCCLNFTNIIIDTDLIDNSNIKEGFCSKEQTYGGCLDVLKKYVNLITDILFIIFIVFVSIQLLVAIFAIILANKVYKKSDGNKGRVIHQEPHNPAQMPHQQIPRPMPFEQLR